MQLPPFVRYNITSFSISLNYKVATYLPNYLSLERAFRINGSCLIPYRYYKASSCTSQSYPQLDLNEMQAHASL